MHTTGSSKTLVCIYKITRHDIPEGSNINVYIGTDCSVREKYSVSALIRVLGAYLKCCSSHQPPGPYCTLFFCLTLHLGNLGCMPHNCLWTCTGEPVTLSRKTSRGKLQICWRFVLSYVILLTGLKFHMKYRFFKCNNYNSGCSSFI
jgi:hypothetical protein